MMNGLSFGAAPRLSTLPALFHGYRFLSTVTGRRVLILKGLVDAKFVNAWVKLDACYDCIKYG